jgi:hypothetical protein
MTTIKLIKLYLWRGCLSLLGKGILRRKGEGGGSAHVREKINAENGEPSPTAQAGRSGGT